MFQGSFHGRTHQTMAMTTSKTSYRAGHGPLPAGVFVAPFPADAAHSDWCLDQVRFLLKSQTAPSETAAMVIEPELGEGGYLPAPAPFLRGLEEICREHGILFVADEVQTGFGRTGKMFAVEHYGRTARRDRHGQGPRLGLPDLGDRRIRGADGHAGRRAATAAPTAATRSAALRRWPPSTSSPNPASSTT